MKTPSHTPPSIVTEAATFIGIDYHKKYSVWHAVDASGSDLGKCRIEHHSPHDFAALIKRWPNPRVVFEASMNCPRSSGSAVWLRLGRGNGKWGQGNGVRLQLLDNFVNDERKNEAGKQKDAKHEPSLETDDSHSPQRSRRAQSLTPCFPTSALFASLRDTLKSKHEAQ